MGRFDFAIANDDRSSHHVSKPLMLAADEDGDQANGVEAGKVVNDPNQIAGQRLDKADGPSGAMDGGDFCPLFAGGRATVEGLKECEIAPVQEKPQQDDNSIDPIRRSAPDRPE